MRSLVSSRHSIKVKVVKHLQGSGSQQRSGDEGPLHVRRSVAPCPASPLIPGGSRT